MCKRTLWKIRLHNCLLNFLKKYNTLIFFVYLHHGLITKMM